MFDEQKKELWSRVGTGIEEDIIHVSADEGLVGHCVSEVKSVVNVPDAYKSPHFQKEVDKHTGFHTGSVLVVPVWADDKQKDKILGAVQIINKQNPDGSMGHFTKSDEDIARVLANHVSSFIRVVDS